MMAYDEDKRKINLAKHGIDLADCEPIFDAPMLTREDDRKHYGEQRLVSLGMLNGTVVVLVWTDRHTGVHVISCRKAEKYEQKNLLQTFLKMCHIERTMQRQLKCIGRRPSRIEALQSSGDCAGNAAHKKRRLKSSSPCALIWMYWRLLELPDPVGKRASMRP